MLLRPSVGVEYSKIISSRPFIFQSCIHRLRYLRTDGLQTLRNKSIGIFCNQTAVNRNDNHILDLIGKDKSIDVKAIFEPEYGIWGVDDSRAKLSGGNRIDPISGAKILIY